MILSDVVERIETKFQLKCKTMSEDGLIRIRIVGIDNCSLSNWILSEFDKVHVIVKEHKCYKFSDEGWVTICLF